MVYRYSWIAGFASIGFAFWQLGRLLLPTGSGAKWQLIILSGLAIGLIVTWTAVTYRVRTVWIILINVGALFLAATRFSAPHESIVVVPKPAGVVALWSDLVRAFDVIRHGIEPVRPITGIVVILTALFWLLGALLAWGLSKDHPFVALLPPLVVALQFATLDRRNDGFLVLTVFVGLVAGTVLAVALDERDRGAGRMSSDRASPPTNAPSLVAGLLVAAMVAAAIAGVGLLGPRLPRDGVVAWRTPGGLSGGFFGSVTYNPYVDIYNGLVSKEGIPLFRAKVAGEAPPSDVYFRLLTMETYQNGQWSATRPQIYALDESPLEEEGYEYTGGTNAVTADIEILALKQEWLPAPYAVTGADGDDAEAFRIRRADTALIFRGDRTYRGMQYGIAADIPVIEPAVVAGAPGGGLSPLFSAAADDGREIAVVPAIEEPRTLPDAESYLELPAGIDPQIRAQAAELTRKLTTSFEKGLAIEHWFRESGGFVYDLDVDSDQGHGDDVLAMWLFDDRPENAGYRRGYCEQFATSMAVMTRSIGIPTRVVLGFTPGDRVGLDEVVVRDSNAHSWVELWIPSVGWVAFDPTPRSDGANPRTSYGALEDALGYDVAVYLDQIPEPVRSEINPDGGPPGGIFAPDGEAPEPIFLGTGGQADGSPGISPLIISLGLALVIIILLIAVIPAVKWARHHARMRRLADGDISAAWEEIVVRLTDLGEEPNRAATPIELAHDVDEAMVPLAGVYARSVYGPPGMISDQYLTAARRSMELTGERLTTRFSPLERMRSHYRLGSLRRRFRGSSSSTRKR